MSAHPEPPPPGGIEPLLKLDDWPRVLNCSRRLVERLRSAGKLPPPDLIIGRMPRWKCSTALAWIDRQVDERGRRG